MPKIQVSKNYRLFKRSVNNRDTDPRKHRKLFLSMQKYGFLGSFPIVCKRDGDGNLTVKDGQNRLNFAEKLGLPVYWVEESVDFDIAEINSTGRTWQLIDFARTHAANGKNDYAEGLEFAKLYGLPLGMSFSLLAGTTGFKNVQSAFVDGDYKIKDRPWAEKVASIYVPMANMNRAINNARFAEACMGVCRVEGFDPKRLLQGAERCREKLVPYATKDAYLDMLEQVYNFGRKQLFGLKNAAVMAMRERNVSQKHKNGKVLQAAAG